MRTSFPKSTKKQFSPMEVGCLSVCKIVEKFLFSLCVSASLISKHFVSLPIVKQFLFNNGVSVSAKSLNPLRASNLLAFFFIIHLTPLLINGHL